MPVLHSRETLAGQTRARPLNMYRDISGTPVPAMSRAIRSYADAHTLVQPESHALLFYLWEHAVAQIQGRMEAESRVGKLDHLLDTYNRVNNALAIRAFYYLVLICCREARHCGNKAAIASHCASTYSFHSIDALNAFPDTASVAAVCDVLDTKVLNHGTLGQLLDTLVYTFNHGKFGSSFGGKKWGVIAECARDFAYGKLTAKMMLDVVWTLQHNTCAIFNKGMLYSQQSTSILQEILDVQRSGQIPHLIIQKAPPVAAHKFVSLDLRNTALTIGTYIGDPFLPGAAVDWHAVHAANSLGNYKKYLSESQAEGSGDKMKVLNDLYVKKAPRHVAGEEAEQAETKPEPKGQSHDYDPDFTPAF